MTRCNEPLVFHHEHALAERIPPIPTDGRTDHRLADPREPQSALPRGGEKRSLASSPQRRVEPTPPHQDGPDPYRHHLGRGLRTTSTRGLPPHATDATLNTAG